MRRPITNKEIIPKEYVICPRCNKIGRLSSFYKACGKDRKYLVFNVMHKNWFHIISQKSIETLVVVALDYRTNNIEYEYPKTNNSNSYNIPEINNVIIAKGYGKNTIQNSNLIEKLLKGD